MRACIPMSVAEFFTFEIEAECAASRLREDAEPRRIRKAGALRHLYDIEAS
jgi:hypothetical protein